MLDSRSASPWRLLILKRAATDRAFPNLWAVPGGHVEPGEKIFQAIERETKEETGLGVDHFVGEFEELHWRSEHGQPNVQFNFVVTVKSNESIRLSREEHSAWMWTNVDDIETLPCSKGMAEVFANAFKVAARWKKGSG